MKVKELVKLLEDQNQEQDIMLYIDVSEDGGMLKGLGETQDQEDEETWYYFKGDNPLAYDGKKLTNKVLTLIG